VEHVAVHFCRSVELEARCEREDSDDTHRLREQERTRERERGIERRRQSNKKGAEDKEGKKEASRERVTLAPKETKGSQGQERLGPGAGRTKLVFLEKLQS
jgi:hypothetical protein